MSVTIFKDLDACFNYTVLSAMTHLFIGFVFPHSILNYFRAILETAIAHTTNCLSNVILVNYTFMVIVMVNTLKFAFLQ